MQRYHRHQVNRYTPDGKILLMRTDDPDEIAVDWGSGMTNAERDILAPYDVLNITIPRSQRQSYTDHVRDILEEHGSTLATGYSERIEWITEDGQWILSELCRGWGWNIRSVTGERIQHPKGRSYFFRTREDAVAYATSL